VFVVTFGRFCCLMDVNFTVSETRADADSLESPKGQLEPSPFADIYAEHNRAIYYLTLRFLGDPQNS